MDEEDERFNRLQTRATAIGDQFRHEVAHSRGPQVKLMRPPRPEVQYTDQIMTFKLYRRVEGNYQMQPSEMRLEFNDNSGYITVEGANIDVREVKIDISSRIHEWDIHMNGTKGVPPPDTESSGGSPVKKPRT